ncbi:MAG: transposase [Flavisolibacter sp.]
MHFDPGNVYHLYNRGNEKQRIFFTRENYLFFLKKVRTEWLPYTDILTYCLMPNHFHFMIAPHCDACKRVVLKGCKTHLQCLSKTIGKTLSSYTQAINIQFNKTGNLFQKKTKAKILSHKNYDEISRALINCGSYIHSNPIAAGLVKDSMDWEFSSLKDYAGLRNGTLCNKDLYLELTGLSLFDFCKHRELSEEEVKSLF